MLPTWLRQQLEGGGLAVGCSRAYETIGTINAFSAKLTDSSLCDQPVRPSERAPPPDTDRLKRKGYQRQVAEQRRIVQPHLLFIFNARRRDCHRSHWERPIWWWKSYPHRRIGTLNEHLGWFAYGVTDCRGGGSGGSPVGDRLVRRRTPRLALSIRDHDADSLGSTS